MASNGPSIEDILAELEARYRRGEGRHQFDLTRRAPAPVAPPAPELPDDPGLAEQILSGAGAAMSLPGRPFQALQREVYRRQFPGVPDEQIPDSGRMLQQAVLPDQAESDRTFTGEAARSATRAVGGMAVDPVSTGLILGAGGFAPKAIQGTLHLALAGMMGKAMYDRAREYMKIGAEKGYLSPEAGAPAGEFALDAALTAAPFATRLLRRGAPEAPPAEVPPEAPGAPGAPPPVDLRLGPSGRPPGPIGPRQPYESPSVTATRPGGDLGALESRGVEYGGLLQRYYARMRERGLGHEEALMVAEYEASRITTDIYGPEAAAGLPQPRVELGPGPAEPAPPKTEVGRLAEPAVAEAKAALEAAIAAADARGDWLEVGVLRRRLGELLITGKVAGESATPAEAPAPGGALPRPPGPGAAPGSPGAPFGSPGAPAPLPPRMVPGPGGTMQAAPAPGPRPDARVEGQPSEPVVPGGATPVEAAGGRQAGMAPEVQGLVNQARDVAQGGTGEGLPPGTTVVQGPTRGAAQGATPTPVIPGVALPPTGAPAPPAPAPPPAVAGPPVPAPQAPALSTAPIQPLNEEVVAFAAEQGGPVNSSLLQRRFKVGYKQAQAWVQELQAAGIAPQLPPEEPVVPQEPPAAPPATEEPSAPAPAPPAPAQAPRRRFRATFDLVSPVQNSRVTKEVDFDAVDQLDLAGQVDALVPPGDRQNTRIENLRFRDMGEAPAEPPARPAAPAPPRERQPDQAPEGIARADMGRRKKGERSGVIVRAYDAGGRVLTQREYATAADAKPTLEAWKRAAAAGRRETRATELSDIEAKVAAAAPGEVPWPSAESVTIAKEWYDDGKRGTAAPALYRALRSARQLGVEVHPGWLEVFPDLRDVQATGRRKRGAGPEAPIARPIEEPMFQASEIRQSSGGDWHLVDRRGNWDSTKFKTREEAEAAARGVEVPLEPVAFERAFAGRGTARPDLPEESRFGPGRYWADNRRVAEIFAEHRDNGAVEEGAASLRKPFVAFAPNVHSPEFRRLAGLLQRRGIPLARIMSAVTDDPVDAFAGLAKLVAPSGERSFWGGAPELNRLLREAGYDGIVGDTRDSPDLPNHRELVEFKPAAQAPARPVETTAPAKPAPAAPPPAAAPGEFANAFEKNQGRFNVGRGAHGSVKVQFPDKGHTSLYRLGKPTHKMKPGEHQRLREDVSRWLGIPEGEAFEAALGYRDQINEGVRDLEEGAAYDAPKYDGRQRPRPDAPRPAAPAPEPERPAEKPAPAEPAAKDAVEGVRIVFASGMTAKGDLLAALNHEQPIGIDINNLSDAAIEQIANAYAQGWRPNIFVDSGAFSAFKKGETQDFDAVIARYNKLLDAISEANVNEETVRPHLFLTVPDVIGNQAETLLAFQKYAKQMNGDFTPVFPIQTDKNQTALQFLEDVLDADIPKDMLKRAVWGIPSNAKAMPVDELSEIGEYLRQNEDINSGISTRIHFLGAGSEKTLRPLLDALGPDLEVTADANKLRAKILGAGSREAALAEVVRAEPGTPASKQPIGPAEDIGAGEVVEIKATYHEPPPGGVSTDKPYWSVEAIDNFEEVAYSQTVKTKKEADALVESWMRREGLIPMRGQVPEPVDLSTVPAFDPLDKLGTKAREGVLAAIGRAPEAVREELKREAGRLVLLREGVEQAESDVDFFKRGVDSIGKRIPNAPKKATAARDNLRMSKSLYESGLDTMRVTLKGAPEADKIVNRINQLLHGKGIRLDPEPRVETPLTALVTRNVERWAIETGAIEVGEAIEAVVEYAKEVTADPELAVPHEDVLEHLEMLAGLIDGMSQGSLDSYIDIPGLGRKKIAAAINAGPDDPNWQKLVDYVTRRMNEWRAFQELFFELSEPTAAPQELDQVATNLSEDLAVEPETEGERHLDKTFMAGLKGLDGKPLSTQEAIGAIRDRRGRLYGRILTAYYDAAKAAASDLSDVPFDVPEGGTDDGPLESPRDKFGQVLIPGMLEAVMSTPQKPVTRDGKPAADFADSPLFTQEEDKKARAEEEKAKKAQGTLFSPRDVFNGRYGPPPRRPTQEQMEARKRWAEKLLGTMKGGGLGLDLGLPDPGAPGAPGKLEGEESAPALRPERDGAKAPDGAGAAGGTRGGGRRRSVPAGIPGGGEAPGGATSSPARQGIFKIVNPREEATFRKPPKYELIPEKLRGVAPDGRPLLTDEQRVGIAKSIEALESGVGFLFEDGTGVGKTRELLGLAEHFRLKGNKVLIVSKASAIEAVQRGGKFYVTGSYDVDSRALGVPIEFKRAAVKMEGGKIYISTYHNLRDQPIDKDTILIFDESHQLKNAGDSEVAQAGIAAIRKAKVTAFASATPGDKPYHMVYLTSIGLLEGKTLEDAMTGLGCVIVGRTKFSKKLYSGFRASGMSEDDARKKATEEIKVWRSTSTRRTNRAVEDLFERLTAKGTVIKREVDMSPLEVVLSTVPVTAEMARIIDRIAEGPFDRKNMLMHMRRQLEPEKLAYTQQLIGQELDAGRSVVVFASRVNESKVEENVYGPDGELIGRHTIMESEGTLKQLRAWLKSEGIEYAEIHGAAEESNESAQRRFQENSARVVIATYEKGGTGINLDDRTGMAPRTMIMMTSPFDSTSVVQAIGRIHRMTTRSAGRIHILFSPHRVDQWNARIVGTKIKQLHAMVSGDVGLLDPELLLAGEEELQAGGDTHYKDVRLRLLGHGPPGVKTDLVSAKHFGAVVHWLKRNKIKMTMKGGDFEIPTLEGYVIEGKVEKVYQGYEYRHYLTWNDDPEAGDLIEHLKSLPPELPAKEQAAYSDNAVMTKLLEWTSQGYVKRVSTQRQYEYFRDVLNQFGAIWGWGGKPGNWSLMTKQGVVFTGELVPGKFGAFGRTATGADDGALTWKRLDPTARTSESERTRFVTKIRVDMDKLVERIKAGEQFKDFYERHERLLQHLFGGDAELFKKILSVTSQANTTAGNVTLALKAYKQMRLGLPLSGYLPAVRAALRRIAKQEGGYARGPKITQYDDAMLERDLDAMAVDRHIARFILGAKNLSGGHSPNAKQREFIKKKLREAMKILGWTGREVHAAAWAAQQMETGLSEDEVKTYDEILRAKAREIYRFRRYFGDVGVSRGWVHAPGRSAQSDEKPGGPIDPGVRAAGWVAPTFIVTRPHLNWLKPERAGTGQKLPPLRSIGKAMEVGLEGVRFLGATVAEALHQAGRVKYEGLEVRYIEDLVALGQIARSTSLEHSAINVMVDGRIMVSRQVTSLAPTSVTHGSQAEINEWVQLAVGAIEATGVSRSRIKIAELHNHPSGDPTPSEADRKHSAWMAKQFGDLYLGDVVIDHERGVVLKPGGGEYLVQRAPSFVDPDPLLQASIDHDAYWGSAADPRLGKEWSRLGSHSGLEEYTRALLTAGWGGASSDAVMMAFLDARSRVRGIFLVPKKKFLEKRWMVDFVGLWGRALGASSTAAAWDGHSQTLGAAAVFYHQVGLVGEAISLTSDKDTWSAAEENMSKDGTLIPWNRLNARTGGDPEWGMHTIVQDEVDPLFRSGEAGRSRRSQPWGGGAGDPGGGPPNGPGPGRIPDDPDDPWWSRRVLYARERTKSRMNQANAMVDPRAAWDFVVLGADAFLRGAKSFVRWIASMVRDVPNIGRWGRSLYEYVRSIFEPRVVERRGRPADFDDAMAAAGAQRPEIRPIPNVKRADIDAALAGLDVRPVNEGAGKPLGVGRPRDLAINVNKIGNEEGLRQTLAAIVRAIEANFDVARRKLTEAEMRAEAERAGLTQADIQRLIREKGALNYAEILAARMLRQEAGIDFVQKNQAFIDAKADVTRFRANGDEVRAAAGEQIALELEREMRASLHKLIGIMYGTAAAGSEAGRALYAHKMFIESLSPQERFMRKMLRGTNPNDRLVQELAAAIQAGDMITVNRLYRQLHQPGFWRTVNEYFINSVLSGPATLGANVMGNLVHESLRTVERGVAGRLEQFGVRQGIERILTGQASAKDRYVGEAMQALKAQAYFKFGLPQAMKMMWQATWSEDPRFMTGAKGEFHPPAIPGKLGKAVRTPGRWMQALDLGAKAAASKGERAAQIFRKVTDEAHAQGGMTRAEFDRRMGEVGDELTRFIVLEENRLGGDVLSTEQLSWMARNREYGGIYKEMKRAADESTFQDDTTRFTRYLQSMRNTYPFLTLIVPFIKTPERILVQAMRRTPVGLAKTAYNIQQGKLSGGLASDRLAQGMLGSAVMAGIYMLAKDGLITGGGPPDPEERRNWLKTGKQPYAIKVGKTWVSMARIEPLATTLGISADLAEATDERVAGDLVDKLHFSIVNNITNKTYLEGIVSFAEAMGDPDRYGARVWKRIIGAAVPNMLASAARAIDPTIRQTDTIKDTLMSRIPILSEELPARLTGTGEPVVRGETALSRFASPFRYSPEAGPEANLERLFLETGYNPAAPPKALSVPGGMGRKVNLTAEERRLYGEYARRATAFARALAKDGDWSKLDVYAKEEVLKRIYRFTHDAARRELYRSIFVRAAKGEAKVVQ